MLTETEELKQAFGKKVTMLSQTGVQKKATVDALKRQFDAYYRLGQKTTQRMIAQETGSGLVKRWSK